MSILRTMYTGVSGINAEGEALGIVGDNISNTNTVGFKTQRAIFEDMLGHSISGNNTEPGAGVKLGSVEQMFTQGSLSNTGVSTDLALNGDGFFVVNGNVAGVDGNFYTRAGQIKIDKDGMLVNPEGLQLQGYKAVPTGGYSASVSSLQVPTAALSPQSTSSIAMTANLDSGATPPAATWDPQNPSATSNFATSISVYDSLGKSHSVDMYFVKSSTANTWDYHAVASGNDIAGATAGTNVEVGTGTLAFNTSGALDTVTTTKAISVDFTGAKTGQAISLGFGSPASGGGTGLDGVTQFASSSSVSSQSQNGYGSGDLSGVAVDGDGVVRGIYTNGQKIPVGQIAVAKFRSNEGLARAGQNLWVDTTASGLPVIGKPGSGGRGAITSGALEQSNVDLAQQFVDLIAHQRAFQANSKTITTADDMLQELVNLKR